MGRTYPMARRGGMTCSEFIERKSQAIASGAVNAWGMTRVGEVWLGDAVIVDSHRITVRRRCPNRAGTRQELGKSPEAQLRGSPTKKR